MYKNQLAAQCLIEAASLLGESAGKNGMNRRHVNELHKNIKARNDAYDKNMESKRKMYKRAGYADKLPNGGYANRTEEERIKNIADRYNTHYVAARDGGLFGSKFSDPQIYNIKLNRGAWDDDFEETYRTPYKNNHYNQKNRLSPKQQKLHDRINNRAKNEAAAECYLRAAQLLDESYDDYDDLDLY